MAISPDLLHKVSTEEDPPELDLSWLQPREAQQVERVRAGRRGMTFDEVERGREVPDHVNAFTLRPRDARRREDAVRTGQYYSDKSDVWSENARLLYEEAVQRQWSSATDIPWEKVTPLPDDLERAMCQLCTFLTEVEFIAGDAPAQWLPKIPNDYYETKLFILSQIMDEARHLDVFRKRAFVNGGGLLSEGQSGPSLRIILDAKDFTEMSAIMHVFAEGFVQSLFRTGELVSFNEAEKAIYRLCAQDESRHLGFGVMHLKYILDTVPERREEIHHYLDQVEGPLSLDITQAGASGATPFFDEAIMILAGGGLKGVDKGAERLMEVRKKQVNEYMHRLEVAGLGERRDRMNPFFRSLLDPPRN
ncbi:MAG: ferritin-like domain-containing protein [Chloroflexi bacterium]|nr:MAG: ferritin-like domain-containing protein [Chloroflexota bacterium]